MKIEFIGWEHQCPTYAVTTGIFWWKKNRRYARLNNEWIRIRTGYPAPSKVRHALVLFERERTWREDQAKLARSNLEAMIKIREFDRTKSPQPSLVRAELKTDDM